MKWLGFGAFFVSLVGFCVWAFLPALPAKQPTGEYLPLPLIAERTIILDSSIENFFAYFVDFTNYPKHFPGVVDMTPVDSLPLGVVGKRYREVALGPLGIELSIEFALTKVVWGKEVQIEPDEKLMQPTFQFLFKPVGDNQTEYTWRCYSRHRSVIYQNTILKIASLVLNNRADGYIESLQATSFGG